jgi:hypothetical protein
VYRPTVKVSKKTPLLVDEIDVKDLKKKIKQKQLLRASGNLKPFRCEGDIMTNTAEIGDC